MAWYHQYQYARVTDPLYRNLRNKALPIIQFDIVESEKKIVRVHLSFGNNSSHWFHASQVVMYKSGKDLLKLGHEKRDVNLYNKITKTLNLKKE